MELTGSQILLEALKCEGVETIFGYPGGAVINIYDDLYDCSINHIMTRHEQAAVHAADGYARCTGKVGVALATSGPGATNTVTGIATAYMDSIPMVIITGQVPTPLIGNDAFQEADMCGITRPCTKHNFLVKDVRDLAKTIKEAFYIARTGRPGPVLVDLPKDVQISKCRFVYPDTVSLRGYKPTYSGNPRQIEKAARMMAQAQRPVLYIGGGINLSGANEELRRLAEMTRIPVTTTLMAMSAFPQRHELALGMLGMHGTFYANMSVTECDLLIAVGARFDDRVTGRIDCFADKAKIIHVDIDPTTIRKNVEVDLPIVGDLKDVLGKLCQCLEQAPDQLEALQQTTETWRATIAGWKESHPMSYRSTKSIIKPQYVIEKLRELTDDDAIITTEVGQHQMWTAQFFSFSQPRNLPDLGWSGDHGLRPAGGTWRPGCLSGAAGYRYFW